MAVSAMLSVQTGAALSTHLFTALTPAGSAWLRLAILTHNVLTALKRLALPAELLQARPKRLRFLFFNTAGRLVHHARRTILRLASNITRLAEYLAALLLLPLRA